MGNNFMTLILFLQANQTVNWTVLSSKMKFSFWFSIKICLPFVKLLIKSHIIVKIFSDRQSEHFFLGCILNHLFKLVLTKEMVFDTPNFDLDWNRFFLITCINHLIKMKLLNWKRTILNQNPVKKNQQMISMFR